MKLIDFIYFLSYNAYVRGNKEKLGAFLISSLWFAALQFMWILIIMTSIELYLRKQIFKGFYDNVYNFISLLISLIILNNIYLYTGNRKNIILNRFKISKKKEKLFWYILIIFFFISFYILGGLRHISKDIFGW